MVWIRIKDTLVTIELNPAENGYTELTLRHEGILKQEDAAALNQGWKGYLENLSLYFTKNNESI